MTACFGSSAASTPTIATTRARSVPPRGPIRCSPSSTAITAEASPSGTGRHHLFVIEADRIPDGVGKDIDYSLGAGRERHGFELYTRAPGYLTFTGRDVQGDLQAISPFTLMRLFNALEAFKPRATKPKANGHFAQSDHDKALDILAHLPNAGDYDDYPKWVGVIAALHAATGGSEAGRRAAAAWSKDGGSRTAQEGVDVLYEYFDRVPPRADLGHLVKEARDHGYEPYPRQRRPTARPHRRARAPDQAMPPHRRLIGPTSILPWSKPPKRYSGISGIICSLQAGANGSSQLPRARAHRSTTSAWGCWAVWPASRGCGVFVEATSSWREPLVVWLATGRRSIDG